MLGYVRPYLHWLFFSVLLSLCIVAAESVSLWTVGTLTEVLFNPDKSHVTSHAFSWNELNSFLKAWFYSLVHSSKPHITLMRVCLIFLVSFFLKDLFIYIKSLVVAFLNLRVVRDVRNSLYSHTLRLPVSYFDQNKSGNVMSIVLNDVQRINAAMTNTISKLVTEPIRLVTFIVLLLIINFKMTLLVFLIYPILGYVIVRIGKTVKRRSKRVLNDMAGLVSVLRETIAGVRIVKMFNMNEAETAKFHQENNKFVHSSFRSRKVRALTSPLTETLGICMAVGLLWYGGREVLSHKGMTAEDFVRYLTLLIFSYQPWKALGGINNTIQSGLAAADRIFGILDMPAEQVFPAQSRHVPCFNRAISFQDVCFTYPGTQKQVLHHISLTVEKGEVVALVGASGAGKSTMLDLLARFYEVNQGSIRIDDQDIRDVDVASLRRLYGIVTQQTVLFNDTVYNNIGYGVSHASIDQVVEAAKAANAHEFITQLAEGYQTFIGENGVMLSGGQCQRISIARALLKNPSVLIFDEATSSLDTESEKLVQSAIQRLMKNRTTLVVAHRLSTVQHADNIVVMDQGRIVEVGDHRTLLAQQGRYKQLYDMQFADPGARSCDT